MGSMLAGLGCRVKLCNHTLSHQQRSLHGHAHRHGSCGAAQGTCCLHVVTCRENVGGAVLSKVLDIANNHARIVACGMVRWGTPYLGIPCTLTRLI